MTRAIDVKIRAPESIALWPVGGISLLVGPSGVGKSTLMASHFAAQLTTGDLTGSPEPVLMIMREDIDAEVTVPRFIEGGGDPALLTVPPPERRMWKFPRDLGELRGLLEGSGARVAFLDPLTSFVSSLHQQPAHERLEELAAMAEEMGVSIVFLHHFIKNITGKKTVKDAIGGGHAVYDIARCIHVYGWEPGGGDERFVLAHEKMSADALQPSEIFARRIVPHPSKPLTKTLSLTDRLVEEVDYTPLQIALTPKPNEAADTIGNESAKSAILNALAIEELGSEGLAEKRVGFGERVWNTARAELVEQGHIEKFQIKDDNGRTVEWRWRKARGELTVLDSAVEEQPALT